MKDGQLLQTLLALEDTKEIPGATPKQIALFSERVGHALPPLLEMILAHSNGGEWTFGRFECSPFIHDEIADWSGDEVWEDLREYGSLETHPLVLSKQLLPVCSDYGDGMYCLDYRLSPPSVVYATFSSEAVDELETIAETFSHFVSEAVQETQRENAKSSTLVEIEIPSIFSFGEPVAVPSLAEHNVVFEFLDPIVLAKLEEASMSPNRELIAQYGDPERTIAYTMYDPSLPQLPLEPTDMRIQARGAVISNGSGSCHLPASQLGKGKVLRLYPVWSLSTESERPASAQLVMTILHSPKP